MDNKDKRKIGELLRAIVMLENAAEAKRFFRDLLTEKELAEFSNRWRAAVLLARKVSYATIIKETGLSSTTVARVSQWLWRGKGGYLLMLGKIESKNNTRGKGRKKKKKRSNKRKS